jgi:hypothetical protein
MSFELEFLSLMSQHCCKLLQYVVVDFLWYRENDGTASTTRGKDFVDKYGRPQPDPQRWPSSRNGQGFKHVADKVHNMGLKFGIHVMRGISLAAVDKNTLILNAKVHLLSHHYFLSLLMILGFIPEFLELIIMALHSLTSNHLLFTGSIARMPSTAKA